MSTQPDAAHARVGPQPAEVELARAFEAAIKRFKMYPTDHPACRNASEVPFAILNDLFRESQIVVLGISDHCLTLNNSSSEMNAEASTICAAIKELDLKSIVLKQGISKEELGKFLTYFTTRVVKTEPWIDLQSYITDKKLSHVAVDSHHYELISDDEKVVSADSVIGSGEGFHSPTSEFMRLVNDQPEFAFDLLTSDKSTSVAVSSSYSSSMDVGKLREEAESCAATLSEEQMLQLIAVGLKSRSVKDEHISLVDLQQILFGIKSVVAKIERPELIPKTRQLIERLNLIDDKYLDVIFDAEYSIEMLVQRELDESLQDLERGIVDLNEVRQIPKRLSILADTKRTGAVTRAILSKAMCGESGRDDDLRMARVAAELVDSAIKIDSKVMCMTCVDFVVNELSDVSMPIPRFKIIAGQGLKLCMWLLVHEQLDDLLAVVSAFHKFTRGKVTCTDKHVSVARDFIEKLATPETVGRLVELLKARTEERKKVMYDILNILPTQASALTLCQLMDCPNSVVRLLALRVLSNYGDVTLKALSSVLDELEPKLRSRSNPVLRQGLWYRLRNVVFVAGNIVSVGAVEIIERLVGDPDSRLAEEIIVALEKIGGEKAGTLLTRYLRFPDEAICRRAAISVGNLGDREAIPHLMEAYRKEPGLRVQLAPILAKVGGEDVVDFLLEAASQRGGFFDQVLNKSAEDEKIAAVAALSQISSRKSLRALKRLRRNYRVKFNGLFGSKSVQAAISNAVQRLEKQLRTGHNGWQIRY